ncbi:tripartite tricarboxylate transporter substrate-binding protein [Cupriavidus sp. H39]|uniref:tripartite tricarboxylate transporter substrate-binding protein n=1 Tax=Cupriavidus sp. H39 TaxID=3401635 RepID=UPI003D04F6F5
MFDSLLSALPNIQSGKLKALAGTSAKRSRQLPNVPTMKDAGFPDFVLGSWNGSLAPAKKTGGVVDKLDQTIRTIVAQIGRETRADGPDAFHAFIQQEYKRWANVGQTAGIENSKEVREESGACHPHFIGEDGGEDCGTSTTDIGNPASEMLFPAAVRLLAGGKMQRTECLPT